MKLIGRVFMILLAGFGGAVLVVGVVLWNKESEAQKPSAPTVAAISPKPSAPAIPTHFYSMVDGFDYGYQAGLSAEDLGKGQATKPLVMFQYYGMRDGRVQLASPADSLGRLVYDCVMPCETVRVRAISRGQLISKGYLPVAAGTIIQLALTDALLGRMKPFTNPMGKFVFYGEDHRQQQFDEPGLVELTQARN